MKGIPAPYSGVDTVCVDYGLCQHKNKRLQGGQVASQLQLCLCRISVLLVLHECTFF